MPLTLGALSDTAIRRPSICLFNFHAPSAKTVHFKAMVNRTRIKKPVLEVKRTGQRGRTATRSDRNGNEDGVICFYRTDAGVSGWSDS